MPFGSFVVALSREHVALRVAFRHLIATPVYSAPERIAIITLPVHVVPLYFSILVKLDASCLFVIP